MRSNDHLFQLIKSLTKGERRNFKLFARLQEGDKKYIHLFDAIDRQETYNEPALLEEFKEERFIKQFSVAKNYLYNFILRTLNIFGKEPHLSGCMEIHQVRTLVQKGLYDQAHKILRRALHEAEREERFQDEIQLLGLEREILKFSNQTREFAAFIAEIGRKEIAANEKMRNLLEVTHLQDKIAAVANTGGAARTTSDIEKLKELEQHPLFNIETELQSERAKLVFFLGKAHYYSYRGDYLSAYKYTIESIIIFEKNPWLIAEDNQRYITRLCNLSIYQIRIGKIEESEKTLEKLKVVKTYNKREEVRVFERYFLFKLMHIIENGKGEEGIEVALELEDKIGRYRYDVMKATEFELYFLLSNFWLNIGQPSKALTFTNIVLNEPRSEIRIDIQCMARIVNMVAHFELGNFDILEYQCKSAYRFFYKHNKLHLFERAALKFFNEITHNPQKLDLISKFEVLYERLKEIRENEYEARAILLFDLEAWAKSKLTGVPMWKEKQKAHFEHKKG